MLCSRPQLPETSSGSLILLLGDQRISAFAWKSYAEYPGFHRYRALGILEFFSEHSLVYCRQCRPIYRPIQRSIQRSTVGRHSVDIAVDSGSTVGRQLVYSQSTVGRQSVDRGIDYRPSIGRYFDDAPRLTIGHMSVIYRSTVGGISVNCRWYIGELSVVYRSTVVRISVVC